MIDTPTFSLNSFRTLYAADSPTLVDVSYSNFSSRPVLGDLEVSTTDYDELARQSFNGSDGFFGTVSQGYFVAPKAADYKFNLFSLVNISIYKSS